MDGSGLERYLRQRVVLDTQGPMLFIGTLESYSPHGYWLVDADVHDRSDGHSPKEVYVDESRTMERNGMRRSNRARLFVERHAVVCISALHDAIPREEPIDPSSANGTGHNW